jgi:hypothetical protein
MTEMLEESEGEAIETELYIEHCGELPYHFVDSEKQANSPLNFSAGQNGIISLKSFGEAVFFKKLRREEVFCREDVVPLTVKGWSDFRSIIGSRAFDVPQYFSMKC